MYPRTLLFGSWGITQPYHRPYAYIHMQMHSYGYTCIHMYADTCRCTSTTPPKLTLHAYYILNEDPLDAFHPSACVSVKMHACACRWIHMDDCSYHSPCSSSLYGLYVMTFHRITSDGETPCHSGSLTSPQLVQECIPFPRTPTRANTPLSSLVP